MNILSLEASGAHITVVALKLPDNAPSRNRFFTQDETLANESSADKKLADETLANEELAVRVTWSTSDTRSLSRELVGRIAQVLENADWEMNDVGAVAVGLGPGSWTSLRVLLATAKTLAQARRWKLCGVPTFDAIARAAWHGLQRDPSQCDSSRYSALSEGKSSTRLRAETTEIVEDQAPQTFREGLIVVASPSRANEIYSKIWRVKNNNWTVVQSESVQTPDELVAHLGSDEPLLVAGDARQAVVGLLQNVTSKNLVWTVEVSPEETAIQIGRLAAHRLAVGESDDPLSLQPLYVAPSSAERVLEQRNREQRNREQFAAK